MANFLISMDLIWNNRINFFEEKNLKYGKLFVFFKNLAYKNLLFGLELDSVESESGLES